MSKAASLRLVKFLFVGGMGVAVQFGLLAGLTAMKTNYLLATALAVEAAVIHNFLWHQRFTWADRASTGIRDFLAALLRFHLSNGLISLIGNLLLMRLLVPVLGWRVLRTNIAVIGLCFVANFLASDRWVFLSACPEASRDEKPPGGANLRTGESCWSVPASAPACAGRRERKSRPL